MYTLTPELELVNEGAVHRLGVWASAREGAPDTRMYGSAADPLAVAAHEQRGVRRPSRKPLSS